MSIPVILLIALLYFNALSVPQGERLTVTVEEASLLPVQDRSNEEPAVAPIPVVKVSDSNKSELTDKRKQIISYALTLMGTPYLYGGFTREGFDCSGFTTYVFQENGIDIKRSSSLQATEGIEVDRSEAAPGDLIIFTGTDRTVRKPGHVGIVISEPGTPIEFIHSSSARKESGVKISQVEGTGYDARFMAIRRVL